MHLDFGLLSMTELRTRPGEVLDRVADKAEAFIIERSGHRKACLVPLSVFFPDISPARIANELKELEDRGEQPRTAVTESRELSLRFPFKLQDETSFEVSIVLPHGYPNNCPRVYATPINEDAPHRWHDGALCLYGVMTAWNPGKNTAYSTLELAKRWLRRYDDWRKSGSWPAHEGSDI